MKRALPHDAALPQLAQALDGDAMAPVFAAAFPSLRVAGCAIDRVKYRPRRNCSVAYRLQLRDPRDGRKFEQRIAARFCSGGEAARRHRHAQARASVASAAGPALIHVPALGMLAHCLPNDARLDALQLLGDAAALRARCLDRVVAALTAGRGRLVDHHTTLVQVVPELRVCARVELRWRRDAGSAVETQTLYAKADLGRDGAVTHAVMQALSDSPAQAGGCLRSARSLLWQADAGLHWQFALPGATLHDTRPAIDAAASARVGEALAALLRTPVPAAPAVGVGRLHSRIAESASMLADAEPAWRPALDGLRERLERGAARLADLPIATLHGDLHPRNILDDGKQLAFIDLDSVQAGPAVIELGGWVADALYRATLDGMAPQQAAPSWRAFLAAHAQVSGRSPDAALLAWSTAHHLLCRRARGCVANLKPGRYEAVPRLLALADAIVRAGSVDAATAAQPEFA